MEMGTRQDTLGYVIDLATYTASMPKPIQIIPIQRSTTTSLWENVVLHFGGV